MSSSSSSSSGGLTATILQAVAVSRAAPAKSSKIDVSRELGLELEETMYANRLLALTNPGKYHEEREKNFQNLKKAAVDTYNQTLTSLLATGLPTENAQAMALRAAANARDAQRQVLDFQFPANANIIGDASMVRNANPYGGLLPSQAKPRAPPRRRAPARRKARARR
jgi:hypothetical protein